MEQREVRNTTSHISMKPVAAWPGSGAKGGLHEQHGLGVVGLWANLESSEG